MEEAALAEAASIEYANTALGEDDVSNLLTILGKGGLPRLEMVGAIPVGALVSDALVCSAATLSFTRLKHVLRLHGRAAATRFSRATAEAMAEEPAQAACARNTA